MFATLPPQERPKKSNRKYYPTRQDLRNHITKAIAASKYCKDDQESLRQKVLEWQTAGTGKFLYRPKGREADNSTGKESPCTEKFLFVHQEVWLLIHICNKSPLKVKTENHKYCSLGLNQKYLQLVLQLHSTQRKTTSMQLSWGALRISSSGSSDGGWLITRECVTNTMILITSISKQNLQTTVITVISFRQIPGYGIDSRFGIRGYVKREQRKMRFSFRDIAIAVKLRESES